MAVGPPGVQVGETGMRVAVAEGPGRGVADAVGRRVAVAAGRVPRGVAVGRTLLRRVRAKGR